MNKITEEKARTIHVRISEDEYNGLKALVEDEGTTISRLLRQGINEMLLIHG